jgi:hypothetical protein
LEQFFRQAFLSFDLFRDLVQLSDCSFKQRLIIGSCEGKQRLVQQMPNEITLILPHKLLQLTAFRVIVAN